MICEVLMVHIRHRDAADDPPALDSRHICLIECPRWALRVSVASWSGGLALELPAVACSRLAYERSCLPAGSRRGVARKRCERTILRNQECPPVVLVERRSGGHG